MDLSQIDPELDRMVNGPRKRRSQSASPLLEPETAGSMIDSLRENSLSTLSATGNALDLPGSMVRDVVAWKNPFDQLLTPFHSINRTTGRDLARKWGIARKRDTWGNAIGGMGVEMALDPLTYATLGASALGKAGRAAKAAGLMDDLGRVAARKAGKPLGMVGNREARMTTTLGDFLGEGGETAAKAQKIIDSGVSADEKLGGLLGVGLPFSDPIAILGQGERAQQVARGIDTLGRGIRFAKVPGTEIQPVNDFLNLFDAPAQGTKTAVGQAIAKEHARNLEKAKTAPRLEALRNIGEMEAAGLTDDASADLLRQGIEGIVPIDQLPVEMRPVANRMRAENAAMLPGDKAVGGRVSELTDDYADYGARHLTTKLDRRPSKGDLDISGYTPNSKARLDFIRNTEGGTVKLKNELFLDENINRLIDSGKPVGEIAAEIERKHGSWLTKDYKTYKEKTKTWETAMGPFGKPASRYREIAEWMGKLSKETRESGIFGNHAILDHEARALASVELRKGAETLARSLNEAMLDSSLLRGGSSSANASVDGSITVGQLVKDLGLSWRTKDAQGNVVGGFEDMIAKFAPNLAGTKTKDLKKMRLDARLAQDLKGTIRSISGPEEIGNIVKFVDSTTNFGKSLLTGVWPAFHVRNLVSGQMHNAMLGMWDRESAYGAAAMMRGGVLKGASQIPAVRAEWERRTGGTAPNAGVSQSVPAGPSPKSSGSAPMILDGVSHDGKPYKYVTDPHSGNRKVLPDKPEWSPEFFSAISENHKRFNDSIEQASKEGLINEIDADIARLIFSDASSEGIRIMSWPKLKDLKETYPSSDMEKVGGNFLWSMQNGWDFNIGLNKKFASSGPEDKGGSLLVLLHELGHMAEFYMKMVHRPADVINDPIKHIHMELGREASKALRAKKGNLLDNWTDLFGETTAKHVSQPIDGENIAQLFADSMLRRIKPEGKIRQIIGEIAHWIAGFLERLKLARPLTKKHTERVDELIGALMGFDGNTPQKLYAKDQDLIRAKLDKKYGKEPDYLGVGGGGSSGGSNIFLGGQPGKPVLTDKEATRILGEIASSRNVIGKFEGNAASMSGVPNSNVSGDIQDVLSGVPRPGYESFDPARVGRKAIALEKDTTMNPIKTRGVAGQEQSKFGPAAAGEEVGHFAEGLNRLAPFINLLKKGYDVDEAARKVGTAQVMYGNKNFTKFETQVMARLFPFYKFTRSNVPFMAKHLIERPGGGYANVVRATNNAQEQGELAPDYVRETASIPVGDNPLLSAMIGKPKDGSDRYLTGFGLMHEDALAFGPSLRGAGLEVLSRMNPMVKGPLEYFTGQTFFQRGPEGGRRLDDLDPTLGRLMTNIGNITGMTDSDKAVKLPVEIEQALANSPASRVLSTARSLTDPRKQSNWGMLPFNVPGPAALMNTLTGARVTDVSPAAKEAIARDLLNAEMKNSGAKVFERIHFSNADKELMSPDVREQAEKLQALANHLAKLTKERKKEKAKESQQRK